MVKLDFVAHFWIFIRVLLIDKGFHRVVTLHLVWISESASCDLIVR